MSRILIVLAVCTLLSAAAVQCVGQSIQAFGDKAKIDWTNLVYTAVGSGAMPSAKEEPNRARAKLKAKDYAKMEAVANLLMAIEGTTIDYESTGRDYMADTTIRMKIQGFVRNAQIVRSWEETEGGDRIIYVEMKAPMFGKNSPGQILLQEAAKPPVSTTETPTAPVETSVNVVLKPDKPLQTTITPEPSAASKRYTGLIVDCSGYKIERCMSPKIRRPDGSEVWGTVRASHELIGDRGIVAYTTSLAEARKHPRAGSNPLIIQAIGRGGGRFFSDPIISDSDADLLLAEDRKAAVGDSGFLDKFNVVFVKDPRVR